VIIPHHRENRLFVILAEQEFFFSGRRLVAKIFEWAQDDRRRVRNCSNDRSGRGLHTRLLKIANSPYYGQTSHRAPVLFGKQFGKSVLKQHTSKKADHLQP